MCTLVLMLMFPSENGAADLPCAETYHGPAGFSEEETRSVRDAMATVTNRTKVYISTDAYGQTWLLPWGWSQQRPGDYDALVRNEHRLESVKKLQKVKCDAFDFSQLSLATGALAELEAVNGIRYDVGNAHDVFGGMPDNVPDNVAYSS